ncbi:hypothetical protein SAY86_020767, partial [Trapa natans]
SGGLCSKHVRLSIVSSSFRPTVFNFDSLNLVGVSFSLPASQVALRPRSSSHARRLPSTTREQMWFNLQRKRDLDLAPAQDRRSIYQMIKRGKGVWIIRATMDKA